MSILGWTLHSVSSLPYVYGFLTSSVVTANSSRSTRQHEYFFHGLTASRHELTWKFWKGEISKVLISIVLLLHTSTTGWTVKGLKDENGQLVLTIKMKMGNWFWQVKRSYRTHLQPHTPWVELPWPTEDIWFYRFCLFVFHVYLDCFLWRQTCERTWTKLVLNRLIMNLIFKDESSA